MALNIPANLQVEGKINSNYVIEALNTTIFQDIGSGNSIVIDIVGIKNSAANQSLITSYESLLDIPIQIKKSSDSVLGSTMTIEIVGIENSIPCSRKNHFKNDFDSSGGLLSDGDVFTATFNGVNFMLSGHKFSDLEAGKYIVEQINTTETKIAEDLVDIENKFNESLIDLKTNINDDIEDMETHITENIEDIQNTINKRIEDLDKQFSEDLDTMKNTIDENIDNLDTEHKDALESINNSINEAVEDISNLSQSIENLETIVDKKTELKSFNFTLLSTNWQGTSAPFTQTVAVPNTTSVMKSVVDVILSATNSTAISEQQAWSLIGYIDVLEGTIKATCLEEKPTVNLNVHMWGVV